MRTLIALLIVAAPALADTSGRPEPPKHPWLSFKAGSWVKYKYVTKNAGAETVMEYTITITEVSKEKIKLEYDMLQNGMRNKHEMEMKPDEDQYRMYEKLETGKERITVNGKGYACTWTSYKFDQNQQQGLDYKMKIWRNPYIVGGIVKMEGSYQGQGINMTWSMELTEQMKK